MAAQEDQDHAQPLHVALMCPGWPPDAIANGIVSYTRDMREGLRLQGAQVQIITRSLMGQPESGVHLAPRPGSEPRWLQRRISRMRLKVGKAQTYHELDATATTTWLHRLARHTRIDLVECEETQGLAGQLAHRGSVPVVMRLHGPWFLNGPACGATQDAAFDARVAAEGRAMSYVQGLTSPTHDLLARVRDRYGLDLPHAAVIANPVQPVDTQHQWTLARANVNRILFVGRFDRHKGGDVILRAFAELATQFPAAELVFVGADRGLVDDAGRRWSFDEYLQAHVPPALRPRVNWLGQQPRAAIDGLRREALVTVIASRYENFPYTALEAMSLGCPTIVTRVGGLAEIVDDGSNGLQFAPGDFTELAGKISSLLKNPSQAAAFGAQAARDCTARYHPRTIARQTLDYYQQTLARSDVRTHDAVGVSGT